MAESGAPFAHLHVHTEYSMLDGAAKVGPLFTEAARLGMTAVAMTDHGNMYASAEFYRKARGTGIKPIIGIEAYVAPASRYHKKPVFWGQLHQRSTDESGMGGDVSGAGAFLHMTMLAENATGLRNLFRLSSLASFEGTYRKPRMDRDLIAEHAGGIIATTGCPSGEVQTRLRLGQTDQALQAASDYRDIFGPGNFFLELMDHGLSIEGSVREGLLEIGRKLGLTTVATNDSHYVTQDQALAHEALLCVQSGARAGRDLPDGIPGLLPGRRGPGPVGQAPEDLRWTGPGLGDRIPGGLHPADHRPRPDRALPDLRAVPQP